MKPVLLLILLSFNVTLLAQEAKTFKVNAGEIVIQVIPAKEQYRFNEFRQGTVFFNGGKSLPAKLNYNLLYREMQFIDSKGDTLAITSGYNLHRVAIGENLFYYQHGNGYLEVITRHPLIQLSKKQIIRVIRSEEAQENGYNLSSSEMVSLDRYRSDFDNMNYKSLYTNKSRGDLLLIKDVTYVFIDKNTRFHSAKLSSLLKLYPKHKKTIDTYVQENQLTFKKEQDLKRLVEFCYQLTAE